MRCRAVSIANDADEDEDVMISATFHNDGQRAKMSSKKHDDWKWWSLTLRLKIVRMKTWMLLRRLNLQWWRPANDQPAIIDVMNYTSAWLPASWINCWTECRWWSIVQIWNTMTYLAWWTHCKREQKIELSDMIVESIENTSCSVMRSRGSPSCLRAPNFERDVRESCCPRQNNIVLR